MTETTAHADYILPGASQYEKVEATFFGGGFPDHVFQLRQPLFEPLEGTLPEPEMHSRLVRALGAYGDEDLTELREAAAESREKFGLAFAQTMAARPELAADHAGGALRDPRPLARREGNEPAALLWGAASSSQPPTRSRCAAPASKATGWPSATRSSRRS